MARPASPFLLTDPLSPFERFEILRLAACAIWADQEVAPAERTYLDALARELEIDGAAADDLLSFPQALEDVAPESVSPAAARRARSAVLGAIAADREIRDDEMDFFFVLDARLPR